MIKKVPLSEKNSNRIPDERSKRNVKIIGAEKGEN